MANDIGPLSIKAVVNAAGVDAGLDETKAKVAGGVTAMAKEAKRFADTWSSGIAGGIKGGAAGLKGWAEAGAGIFQKALENPARALNDWAVGGMAKIAGAAPLVGPLLALPFEGLHAVAGGALDTFKEGSASIKAMGEAALKANMEIGQFQAVAKTIGDTDLAVKSMVKFREAMTNAALAGPEARNAFTSLGLDANALMGDADAFGTVAKAIRGVGDGLMQSHYAFQIFGKGAANVMPLLTTDKLDKTRASIDAFGAGFRDQDFASIKEAEKAAKQFATLKDGFTNQVTIAVAPILAELANSVPKLTDLGVTFDGLAEAVINFAETVAKAGAVMVEAFSDTSVLTAAWDVAFAYLDAMADKFIAGLAGKLVGQTGILGHLATVGAVVFGDNGPPGELSADVSARRFRDAVDALSERMAGSTAWDALDGFFGDVRDRFAGLKQAARDNDPFVVWMESANQFQDSLKSPLDSFAKQMATVRGLMESAPMDDLLTSYVEGAAGNALNKMFDDAGFLAAGKAVQQLRQAYGSGGGSMLSGALVSGTAGAASAVNQARFSAQDTLADLLRTANQQREQLIKQGAEALNDPAMKVILKGRTP